MSKPKITKDRSPRNWPLDDHRNAGTPKAEAQRPAGSHAVSMFSRSSAQALRSAAPVRSETKPAPATTTPATPAEPVKVPCASSSEPTDAPIATPAVKAADAAIANKAAMAAAKALIDDMMEESRRLGQPVVRRVRITLEIAVYVLSLNEGNRNIGPAKLEQYMDDMVHGRWLENGDGITIADTGLLNNGQHRMHAIAKTGLAQTMNLTVGVTRESRATVDINKTRTPGDHLKLGGYGNSNQLGAVARSVISYKRAKGQTMGRPNVITIAEIIDMAGKDQLLHEATKWGKDAQPKMVHLMTSTIAGLLYYLTHEIDPKQSLEFLVGVRDGAIDGRGLDVEDPRYVVRDRLMASRTSKNHIDRIELLFRAWNAFRGVRKAGGIKAAGRFPDLQ